jgi:hypothetical protein
MTVACDHFGGHRPPLQNNANEPANDLRYRRLAMSRFCRQDMCDCVKAMSNAYSIGELYATLNVTRNADYEPPDKAGRCLLIIAVLAIRASIREVCHYAKESL